MLRAVLGSMSTEPIEMERWEDVLDPMIAEIRSTDLRRSAEDLVAKRWVRVYVSMCVLL